MRKKYSPHQWNRLEYGTQVKKETEDNMLEPLSPEIVKTTQTIVGNLLFYGITVEIPMLVALGTINAARTKKNGHQEVHQKTSKLLHNAPKFKIDRYQEPDWDPGPCLGLAYNKFLT